MRARPERARKAQSYQRGEHPAKPAGCLLASGRIACPLAGHGGYAKGSEGVPVGSVQEHVNITFVSDDPRLPIENRADTRFFAPDGTLTVVGKPVQLIGSDGGVVVLDAGRVVVGEDLVVNGPHPYLETRFAEGDLALAKYYCPTTGSGCPGLGSHAWSGVDRTPEGGQVRLWRVTAPPGLG